MKVPSPVTGNVRRSSQGQGYLSDAAAQGIADFGNVVGAGLKAFGAVAQTYKEREDKTKRFAAMRSFSDFETQVASDLVEAKRNTKPEESNFLAQAEATYANSENKYISTLPPELQDEFRTRAAELKQRVVRDSLDFQYKSQDAFYQKGVDTEYQKARTSLDPSLGGNPANLEAERKRVGALIDATDLPDAVKAELRTNVNSGLEAVTYKAEVKERLKEAGGGNVNLPGDVGAVIDAAAEKYGVSKTALRVIAWIESKGNPSAKNPRSSAGGLFQQIDSNARQYGVTDRFDPAQSAEGAAKFMAENTPILRKVLGREPTVGELYLAHQQGPGGAQKLLSNPNALAVDVVGYDAVRDNGGAPGMTAQQFANLWINKANAQAGETQIDDDPRFANLPYEDRLALRSDAERDAQDEINDENARKKAEYEQNFNQLMLDIHDNKAGQFQIDQARQTWMGDYDSVQKAETALKERDKEANILSGGLAKLGVEGAIWSPTDEDDKKRQNAIFNMQGPKSLFDRDQSYVTNGLVPMAARTGDLPTDAAGMLEGMTRSNNSQQMLFAYDTLSMLKASAPAAFEARIGADLAANVQYYEDRKDSVSAEELAAGLRGGTTTEERQARIMLRERGNDILSAKEKGVPKISELVATVTKNFDQNFIGSPSTNALPWAGLGLERDFRVAFLDEYERRGNVDEATAAGIKQLERIWGVSQVGGDQSLMRYPPEKVGYKPILGSFDWIGKQVRGELGLPEGSKFQLLSDEQTRDEWISSQRGGTEPPSYMVVWRDEEGTPRQVMQDGKPARIWFKPSEVDLQKEEVGFELKRAESDITSAMNGLNIAIQTYGARGEPVPSEFQEALDSAIARKREAEDRMKSFEEPLETVPFGTNELGNPVPF